MKPNAFQAKRHHQIVVGKSIQKWYREFKADWKDCQSCDLCKTRSQVVHFRGIIPAKVCFIGEAPGESEDELGRPFVGPAGRLLDEMIAEAGIEDGDFCVINIVGCYPGRKEDGSFRQPDKKQAKACSYRTGRLIDAIKPRIIIAMGQVAQKYLSESTAACGITVPHPSAILRSSSPSDRKRFVLTVRQAFANLQ